MLTRYEQETHFYYCNEKDSQLKFDTFDKKIQRKFKKMANDYPTIFNFTIDNYGMMMGNCEKKYISINFKKPSPKKELSLDQKERIAKQLSDSRKRKTLNEK